MSSEDTLKSVGAAISVVQLLQAGLALINSAKEAVASGKTEVSADEIHASIQANDEVMAQLASDIVRAKAEGR